jgi:branched-chain amino acid transport system substrate-binding protein
MISRRNTVSALACAALMTAFAASGALAQEKVVKVGINLSFTGADAESAARIANGGLFAFEEANAAKSVKGYRFEVVKFDDATATAGQYDPAQAATNARRM